MALNTQNTDAISFKRLGGKSHTQQGFSINEEKISSNISISYSTVFGENVNPKPATVGGLTSLYATDGKVEKIRFDVEILPDTFIGTNRSQGYCLKLPAGYSGSGALGSHFSGGTKLYTALGKLQLVPSLYGTTKPDGSTEYDPILYQTNGSTIITKFDSINWYIDPYSGIIFVQDPPAGYDVSAARPGYVEAYLYVGNYLDDLVTSGLTGTSVQWSNIVGKPATFPPSFHTHPISGVTGLQSELNNRINISQIGVPGGIPPLDANGIVPSVFLPTYLKEVFVVANVAERTARFVASGATPGVGQIESFEGLRVFMLDATGAPELPGVTGSSETVDTTGFLEWSGVTQGTNVILDWSNITSKPSIVNSINAGAGLDIVPLAGTGNTTITASVDDKYIETTVPLGQLSVKQASIDATRLKFQAGSGTTGQYVVRGTGNTFNVVNLPVIGVSTISVVSGITNIGTATDPILRAEADSSDNSIEINSFGIRVKNNGIGSNKLKLGSAPQQINADLIPIHTGSTYTQATDVGTAIEQLSQNGLLSITGATNAGTGSGTIFAGVSGKNIQFRNIKKGQNVSVSNSGNDVIIAVTGISATTGTTIGPAEDGSYTDGLFVDFTPSTPIGTAVDRFNEVLKALSPSPAPNLTGITSAGTFVSGKLSFGSSKAIAGFTNVGTAAGNAAIDINGNYPITGTRLGITNTPITGVLNDSVTGGVGNIPFADNAFGDGDKGRLIMYKNGLIVSQLILSGTTAATSNSRMSVTAVSDVKFANGQSLNVFKYRTGTYNIPVSAMTNGYNYIRIVHSGATFSRVTNFMEWVYDNDASNITIGSTTGLTNVTLGGTKYISGVVYRTGGTAQYQGTYSNVYKNIFSNSSVAIDFISKENLGAITNMNITGLGILNRTGSTLQTLPDLDVSATNPQNTTIAVAATMPITASVLLGNVGATGRIRSSSSVLHPFNSQSYSGGQSTLTGFLINNTTQPSNLNSETFNGETDRLEARNYAALTYANVNAGTYNWTSSQNLISGNAQHNTGLLVFNGELMYPNAAYLTTQYGITTGNFAAVTYAAGGNPNYTSASLSRDHYRKFKSANGTTQSTLTFTIEHTGTAGNFLTNGGTGGTVSGNNIKVEFLIMRSGGAIHGWANPFASTGNPEGIAVTSASQVGSTMTVTCTLSTAPRVALNDIVIVRVITSSSWSNRIQTLSITNI